MLLNHRRLFFLLLVLFFALSASHVHAQTFSATGYSNLEDIPANDWGGSEITFDKVPGARLVIDGMGHALWQPSDVRVNFGYLETYDPDRSNGDVLISWETIGDEIEKIYNRVWVESQNAARIKVVFIGGLIYLENNDTYGRRIAHSSYWSGSPWGPQYLDAHPDPEATGWGYGDWAEEVYYIYPDGTHTRYAKVYSAFAHVGQAFDTSRLPSEGDYQFEFIEAAFQIPEGNLPNTTVNPDTSVLLADMAGNSAYIGYEPENPGLVDVLNGFAPLRYGNMMAVNMVDSPHSPFLIGLPDSTELRPYECFTNDQDCSTFYMWGAPCTYGCVSPLGHLINWDQFEKQQANQATNTPGFISNVFLQGWIPDTTSGTAFSQLGKSWITPADMNITSNGFTGGTYEVRERAYQVTKEVTGTDFTCTLQGTSATPIRNPAIVIQDWGSNTAHVTVDEVTPSDVRVGHEGNDLVVWIEYEAETNIDIAILSVPDTATFTLSTSINGTGTGNISLNPTGGTYTNGTTVTLTANPNGGSNFNNWSGDIGNNTTTTNPITITMDGNKNISANFNSCSSGTWTQVNDDDVNATYSGTWNSVTAMNGYQNDAHFTESNGASVTYSFTGTQVRLYMWAEEIAQVVNVSIDGGSDTLISIPQNPGNNVGTSIQVFQSPVLSNGNHTLTVTYVSGEVHIDAFEYFDECPTVSQIPLTTCVNGQGNISVNPSEGIYNEGTVVNLTAIPASGWQFDNWSGGASGTTNPLSFTINKKRVACVGNSITEGALLNNPPQESYPGQLQDLLGAAYEVLNFGYSGATVSNNGGLPYMSQQTYTDALASQPDIVTIMLGTNDTFDWMLMGPDFESTLTSMVQSFLDLPTNPQVILCYPPAMQGTSFDGRNSILVNNIIPIIDNIAQNLGLQTLDIYNPTVNQPAWFPDGVHPNIQGAAAIANLFNTAISNTSCVTANFSEVTTNPPPTPTLDGVFPAYYTRTSFNEHTAQISGEHADVVVKIGDVGDLVFSREFSFRPNWIYNGSSQLVGHLATINGDGPTEGNFDARCRYAYARIVENTASQVVVHWRYFPDLNNLDPTAVVHELYYINSDGSVIREYKSGTANIDEWLDENNKTTQTFNLTASGITNIQTTNGSFSAPTAVNGNPTLGAVVGSPVAHWTFDEAQGNFAAPNGTISGHKSLWKKGVSGTALGFDGYFSQVAIPATQSPVLNDNFTLDTWVVMGAFPFGNAPIVHHSSNQGQEGYYLGVNEAGQAIFIVNGVQATTSSSLPLNQWVHLVGTYGDGDMQIYVDGVASANANAAGIPSVPSTDLLIGLNNQVASPTAPVFEPQTYPSIFGFEGLIDEVVIYNSKLNQNQVTQNFNRLTDNTIKNNPDIDLRILPGQPGVASNFGATQSRLAYHDLWDNMWRASEYEDITVKFDDLPTSYVYWRGTTHGVNMVTENNLWMSDQSEEIFCGDLGFPGPPSGNPSLSEHMSDKEARYSHVRLIENTPARVVVHWRYAVADVFYDQCDERNFVDEYHTIYPDGTLYRNLRFWGNGSDIVRSDIQPLTSPGLLPADIVNSPALSIANVDGSSSDLIWNNGVPSGEDEILMANFKSNWKIYQALPSGFSAGPWGADNQSAHSTAPYAGPWNHWPVSRIVSDGRQAFDGDGRVNHFALSTGGGGTVVMYGFSNQGSTSTQDPTTVIPTVQAWRNSPPISTINGGTSQGYNVDQREYNLTLLVGSTSLDFTLNASSTNPMSNPCFVIKNWDSAGTANLQINGMTTTDFRQGIIYDTDGTRTLIIYVPTQSTSSTTFTITTNIISYQSLTLCSGDAFGGTPIYNDTTITQIFSLPSLGYDSTVVTSIVVTPIVNTQIDATICNGEAYTFGSSTFTSSGTYQNTLTSSNGCDSIVTLNLSVQASVTENLMIAICEGSSYTVGNNTYTTSGTYQNTLIASSGCDSIVTLNLSVQPSITENLTIAICEGSSYTVGNNTYTTSGTYQNTLMASSGCDSVVTLNLSVQPSITEDLTVEICEGSSYTVGNNTYTTSGTYQNTLMASSGCDSIVTLNLSVQPSITENLTIAICEGSSYSVGNNTYTTSGTYQNTLTSLSGCDSIVMLNLSVQPSITENLTIAICEGSSYTVGNNTYTASGTYQNTLMASSGCDSIVTLNLSVQPTITENLTAEICEGETYTILGNSYNTSGVYEDTLTTASGCDIIINLDLTVFSIPTEERTIEICEGETYSVAGNTYDSSGTYENILTDSNGCDSIVILNLTVHPTFTENLSVDICEGEVLLIGDGYDETGIYEITFTASNGCDSVVILDLFVQPAITENLSIDICEGETYSIGGNTYDESGTYENTLVGTNGCNILVILDLIIHPITNENIYEEICEGDFYSFGNQTLTEAGDYQATFITQNNCDSIVNLELQVLPNEEITIDEAINYGDTFNGVVYFSDTTLVEIYAAQNGCDSIVTINLSILTNTDELHNERMSLKVYPIPTYENVLLNYILKENAYLQFRLYNTSGQLLSYIAKSQLAGEHTDTLDLEYLPQGVYWLSVQIDQQTMVKKIVKIAY